MSDGPHAAERREDEAGTQGSDYALRLQRLSGARWKRLLRVQAPYRWNLRRLREGRVLEIGCGIGRNLEHLAGNCVGVDHNAHSVAIARARGLAAVQSDEFLASHDSEMHRFDTLLVAHVLEHMSQREGDALLVRYLPFLKPGGRVVLITPEDPRCTRDPTHVRFVDRTALTGHVGTFGGVVERAYCFPFPEGAGRVFPYNEFVVTARLPPSSGETTVRSH